MFYNRRIRRLELHLSELVGRLAQIEADCVAQKAKLSEHILASGHELWTGQEVKAVPRDARGRFKARPR